MLLPKLIFASSSLLALGNALVGPPSTTCLPQFDTNLTARAQAIQVKRAGWYYGPALLGGSAFPGGDLANARFQRDIVLFQTDAAYVNASINQDLPLAAQTIGANGGFHSLDDYVNLLYVNEWTHAIPKGEDAGILTNYTQDLLFSMERLSSNPYPLHRVKPTDTLLFRVDDATSIAISTLTLKTLQNTGRLFMVDHSYQSKYPSTSRFGAYCTAYFFIHPVSGDFLPLAIATNIGANLIYTPLDAANDWLLAKILFNVNDFFYADLYHLAATHDVDEIVHSAAYRTLSDNHPVMVLLEKLMVGSYAVRIAGAQKLFNPGELFDQGFFINSTGALQFVQDFYPTAGAFQANYLERGLFTQGLLEEFGPPLKHFPFYEDASKIRNVIADFMTAFVNAYYTSDSDMNRDRELQNWYAEAQGLAQVINFPCFPNTAAGPHPGGPCVKKDLIDVLTHFAYLSGVVHHALNTGDLVLSSGTLPFHPLAIYASPPTTKGLTTAQLLSYLPPPAAALFQIDLLSVFNRPQFEAQNRTLIHAYDDVNFLSGLKDDVRVAAGFYKDAMTNLSTAIRGKGFDANGLCQGMPFVWKNLDPGTVPYAMTV